MHVAFKPGLRVDLRLILRHVLELPVHGVALLVGSQSRISRQTHHPARHHALPLDGWTVGPAFGPVGQARLIGRREGIKAFVGPVLQHAHKNLPQIARIVRLQIRPVRIPVGRVRQTHGPCG